MKSLLLLTILSGYSGSSTVASCRPRTAPPGVLAVHTIVGFVVQQLGHLPKVGEHFVYESWRFEVVDLDGRRTDKVLAIPPKAEEEGSR